jgi:DNA-binding response OmpR family regulator
MGNPFESRPRIFVVDDEPEIAKMLSVILQTNLFDAVPYFDSQAALDAARLAPPDYLISDIGMPGMNGIELAIAVQREIPACKVLQFSGQVEASELISNAEEGGHSFSLVQKPIHPTKLVAAIGMFVKRTSNQPSACCFARARMMKWWSTRSVAAYPRP